MTERTEDERERPSGPLDTTTLEILARRAGSHPLVLEWRFQPDSLSPRHLELQLDSAQYPSTVSSVRLDIRWFEGGDYSVHYLENRVSTDDPWQCRWDRHSKPDSPRAHFHPPPDAGGGVEPSPIGGDGTDGDDDDHRHHHLDVLFAVLDWLGERLQDSHR